MQRKYEYRRHLPHIQKDQPVFITFSTLGRWTLPEMARGLVLDACHRGDGWKFELHAAVVMPDHVHLLLTPQSDASGPYSLAEIVAGIKRGSAAQINRLLRRKGSIWQDEWFDHLPRRYESLAAKVYYVCHNPVRAKLAERPEDYRWTYRQAEI
ncbi:MAG TPA: transposase [Terriglobales bacterium]|jgi:putative DNA methylase|nr:transposase [Terriglobales bacterium]